MSGLTNGRGLVAQVLLRAVGGSEVVWLRAVALCLAAGLAFLVWHHHSGVLADLAACRAQGLGR